MRIDRIPFISRRALRRELLWSAKNAFPRVDAPPLSLFVAPDFASAVSQLDLQNDHSSAPPGQVPPESGRARSRILPLKGHESRLHLRPARHGGALAFLWRSKVAGPNRFLRELEVTRTLKARGAPVATPVLVQTCRRRWLTEVAVGSLYEEDTVDLLAYLKRRPPTAELRTIAQEVARAIRRFHDCGGRHPDLHAANVLVSTRIETPKTRIVDLDRAEIRENPSATRRMRELMRLHRSLLKHGLLEHTDHAIVDHFIKSYTGGDDELERQLRAALPREKQRERLHALSWTVRRRFGWLP